MVGGPHTSYSVPHFLLSSCFRFFAFWGRPCAPCSGKKSYVLDIISAIGDSPYLGQRAPLGVSAASRCGTVSNRNRMNLPQIM